MSQFSKKEAIKFGWQKMQQNFGFLLSVVAIMVVVQIVQGIISHITQSNDNPTVTLITFLINIGFAVINVVLSLGIIKVALQIADDKKPTFDDLLNNWTIFVKYFLTQITYSITVAGGFLLGVLPFLIVYGIAAFLIKGEAKVVVGLIIATASIITGLALSVYWGVKYQFAQYFAISEGQGAIASMKSSAAITTGEMNNLFLFGVVVSLINIAGLLVVFIGLFATVPTGMIAVAYVFRKLQHKSTNNNPTPLEMKSVL